MKYKTVAIVETVYSPLILDIKHHFQKIKETLFKQRNTIKIITFNEKKYAVKSFKIPHLLNQVVYKFFRKSKAQRSYENSVKLMELKVNTPKPIGYIGFSTLFLFKESYYVSELFEYDFEIRAVFKDKNFNDRERVLKEFIAFTYDLHEKGVYHIDYSLGNILIKKIDNKYIFSIIDVNRMKFITLNNTLRMQNLSKLTKEKEDIEYLLKEYALISTRDENVLSVALEEAIRKQQHYLENKKRLKKLKS